MVAKAKGNAARRKGAVRLTSRDHQARGRLASRNVSLRRKSTPARRVVASSRQSGKGQAARGKRAARGARGEEDEEDEDEDTDDEDSDDEQREIMEERLRHEETLEALPRNLDKRAKQAPHLVTDAKPVPYQIAIPTYERWRPVKEMTNKVRFRRCNTPFILMHTLAFLSRQRVPKANVTLFVANAKEVQNYRKALHGSDWQGVKIVVSVLGNKNSRNFIYRHYKVGTYVVSIDDDVERISWKFREGITHHVLGALPPGAFQQIIFDAYQRMREKKAFLWGLNTSQNPRHMRSYGVSLKNGLVNGYLNGFICRPRCSELLRQFADATEDSEFAVRHYAKDGVVLRYRMYAGITSPYLNRGGLQTKFEKHGERITAEQRSAARKSEERWGAMELHKLFPKIIGPPRPRRDAKTMEVVFHPHGYPPGEGIKRRMIAPRLLDDDEIRYAPNPKLVGSHSYKLYQRYSSATSVAEAKRLGARGIDFAFDSNWGYLTVSHLSLASTCDPADACLLQDPCKGRMSALRGKSKMVKVRVLEMSEGHKGMDIPRSALAKLAARSPAIRRVKDDEKWTAMDGPFVKTTLDVLRVLLRWATTGRLVYERRRTKAVYTALSKACGNTTVARRVKQLEADESRKARIAKKGIKKSKSFRALRIRKASKPKRTH